MPRFTVVAVKNVRQEAVFDIVAADLDDAYVIAEEELDPAIFDKPRTKTLPARYEVTDIMPSHD